LAALAPPSADAYASLSRSSWKQVSAVVADARAREGLEPEDDRPVPAGLRADLLTRWSREIDEGIALGSKALAIDPEHDAALTTTSQWHLVRADLAETIEGHEREVRAADELMHKALAIRKARAERGK